MKNAAAVDDADPVVLVDAVVPAAAVDVAAAAVVAVAVIAVVIHAAAQAHQRVLPEPQRLSSLLETQEKPDRPDRIDWK